MSDHIFLEPKNKAENRHAEVDRSFGKTVSMLSTWAKEPLPLMDEKTKIRQRAAIRAFASHADSKNSASGHGASERFFRTLRRLWLGSGLAAATVVAVFVLLFIQSSKPAPVSRSAARNTLERLLIPEALAADAFSLYPEKQDAAGMAVDSDFVMKTQMAVTADQVKKTLRVSPDIAYDVEQVTDRELKIRPARQLYPGTVYRVTLAATIAKEDGARLSRDFQWAVQTREALRRVTTIPANETNNVPVHTGIEITFNRDGWVDPTLFFSIKPETKGRFETHGRTLVFVPEKPLQSSTIYEIVLTKGFGIKDSETALEEDVQIRFETASDQPGAYGRPGFSFGEFLESVPGMPIKITMNTWGKDLSNAAFEVQGFALQKDEAKALMERRLRVPVWAYLARQDQADFARAAKTQAFRVSSMPVQDRYQQVLPLPKLDASGWYVLRVSSPQVPDQVGWALLQVTRFASYMVADKTSMIVWVVDAVQSTNRGNIDVMIGTQVVKTDATGLAHLPTPSVLTWEGSESGDLPIPYEIVEIFDKAESALEVVRLDASGLGGRDMGFWQQDGFESTWGYLYLDRPIYRTSDTVQVFGVAQDRTSRNGIGSVELRLRRPYDGFDLGTGKEKAYQILTVQTDAAGRFQASVPFVDLAAGGYDIALVRDGRVVTTRGFEVRGFSKPSYAITILPESDRLYNGDTMRGTVRAQFYDGTPVARASLQLTIKRDYARIDELSLVTDQDGAALFEIKTQRSVCADRILVSSNTGCPDQTVYELVAKPSLGEEGEIIGINQVIGYDSALAIEAEAMTVDQMRGRIEVRTRERNLASRDGLGGAFGDRAIRGILRPEYWVEVLDGYSYDFIEKISKPRYRYERRYDPPISFAMRSDATGFASHEFTMKTDRSYTISLVAGDDRGRMAVTTRFVSAMPYGEGRYDGAATQTLRLAYTPKNETGEFAVDEPVKTELLLGEQLLSVDRIPGVLYLVASRGIKQAEVIKDAHFTFPYEHALAPNASFLAVVFHQGAFETVIQTVSEKRESHVLAIETTPDQDAYVPGATVRMHLKAVNQQTRAAAAYARVAVSAIDKALGGIVSLTDEQPVNALYGYVADGLVYTRRSHDNVQNADFSEGEMTGLAERGGGGGSDTANQNVRRLFKDTAAFTIVTLDQNGEGNAVFTVPDNLTTWRTELVAISDQLDVGSKIVEIPVRRNVFIEAVVPPRVLVGDKPVIKLRAYGPGLAAQEPVSFTVDAPAFDVVGQIVTSTANAPVYLALDRMQAGKQKITIRLQSAQGTDALERTITVAPSFFLKDELVTMDVAPGSRLPELGVPETDVYLTSKERGAYLSEVRSLSVPQNARVDAQIAGRMMARLMQSAYASDQTEVPQTDLSAYQDEEGGIRLLPYGSADLFLSAEIAASSAEGFDRMRLTGYFWKTFDRRASTREMRLAALAGLAALGEPVLPMLQSASSVADLSWREILLVSRGLLAAGDTETGRALFDRLMQGAQIRDSVTWMTVSGTALDAYEATAEAAAFAAQWRDPRAQGLHAFMEKNWHADGFPVLAKARYLNAVVPMLNADASVAWTFDGKNEDSVSLQETPSRVLTLTAEEARRFRVTRASGRIAAVFIRRTPGRPVSVPEINITRTFQSERPLEQLQEGDVVRIVLKPEWKEHSQHGCYVIHDHLPAAWQPVIRWDSSEYRNGTYYPSEIRDNEVSFTACKSSWWSQGDHRIVYLARVVARGLYMAEGPSMQHMEFPSVAAVGEDQLIMVK